MYTREMQKRQKQCWNVSPYIKTGLECLPLYNKLVRGVCPYIIFI